MTKKDHLPFFGIGPLYVALIVALTAVGMILSAKGCLGNGIIPALKIPMLVVGILVAALGAFIWGYAFFFDKIDDSIKNNRLYTDWAATDQMHVILGYDLFYADGGMFLTYAHNSEVWMKLKYSF